MNHAVRPLAAAAAPPRTADRREGDVAHPASAADGGFGVYVHWPFCQSKCPYCDFNSHVRHGAVDQARFVRAFRRELTTLAARTDDRTPQTVFFGGGTPSLMEPATVAAILTAIDDVLGLEAGTEITLEANPSSVEKARFEGFAAAGVNRVSLGVQSLVDADLVALGRRHDVAAARAALALARRTFAAVSADLIYARPGQSAASWARELAEAIDIAGDHLSLYQLTIEPQTRFFDLAAAGKLTVPDDDHAAELYEITHALTRAAGFARYEVSNHARPGGQARHNLIYWRGGRYIGIGPGAHGRLATAAGRLATSTIKHPESWLEAVELNGHGLTVEEWLTANEIGDETLVMGLRLAEGIDLDTYARRAGRALDETRVRTLVADGLLAQRNRTIMVPDSARLLTNAVVRELAC